MHDHKFLQLRCISHILLVPSFSYTQYIHTCIHIYIQGQCQSFSKFQGRIFGKISKILEAINDFIKLLRQKKTQVFQCWIHIFCNFKIKDQIITPVAESQNIILKRSIVSLHDLDKIYSYHPHVMSMTFPFLLSLLDFGGSDCYYLQLTWFQKQCQPYS